MNEDERRDEDGLWKRAGEQGKSWILVKPSGKFYDRQKPPPREERPPWQPPENAMRISELIAFLEEQREKHGDLKVMYEGRDGGLYPAEPHASAGQGALFLDTDRDWK